MKPQPADVSPGPVLMLKETYYASVLVQVKALESKKKVSVRTNRSLSFLEKTLLLKRLASRPTFSYVTL